MIISHKHRFIFIKTEKTAGTSIEIALSKFCGPDDVITPISPDDEAIRREKGHRGPQHHLAPPWEYGWRDMKALATKGRRKLRFYNHAPASHIRPRVSDRVWRDYFKFCFERNPWDRVISAYYWKSASRVQRHSLSDFVDSPKILSLKQRGIGAYTIDGKVAVDRVCRFESVTEDLEEVRSLLKLPEPLDLPFAKSASRQDKRSYREILSDAERDKISKLFAEEIALMGYAF